MSMDPQRHPNNHLVIERLTLIVSQNHKKASRFVGNVGEATLEGIVIDNFFFGIATRESHRNGYFTQRRKGGDLNSIIH